MKKAMWIISFLSLILTAAALQFMPDVVPMHYNVAGEINRWGSKYENLIFPIIIIAMSLFWHLFISYFEKKAAKSIFEKERSEAAANAKVLKIMGILEASLFTVMQAIILYSAYVKANTAETETHFDLMKVTCILVGAILVIFGNFMPKTKKNPVVGVRIRWSMYNDITWMKSNRFGAVTMTIAGLAAIVTAICASSVVAMILVFVYLLAAVVVTLIYSHGIYRKELTKEGREPLRTETGE